MARPLLSLTLASGSACESLAGLDDLEGRESRVAEDDDGVVWVKSFGDSANQTVTAVALDGDGNILIGGWFGGILDLGGGVTLTSVFSLDLYVAKLSPEGDALWARSFPASLTSRVAALAVDSSGQIVVTGRHKGALSVGDQTFTPATVFDDVFLFKLGAGGDVLWARSDGYNNHQDGMQVTTDSKRNILLAGWFQDAIDFALDGDVELVTMGGWDAFIAKFSPEGELDTVLQVGGVKDEIISTMTRDAETGDIVIAGTMNGTLDVGGQQLESHDGEAELFVAKLDADLKSVWGASLGTGKANCYERCEVAVAVGSDSSVLMTAAFADKVDLGGGTLEASDTPDLLVAKFGRWGDSGAPDLQFGATFGGPREQRPYAAGVVGGHDLVVSGLFDGVLDLAGIRLENDGDGVKDFFLARFDAEGHPVRARQLRNTDEDSDQSEREKSLGPKMVVDPASGAVVMVGSYRGKVEVGSHTLVAAGALVSYDIFIAKLVP